MIEYEKLFWPTRHRTESYGTVDTAILVNLGVTLGTLFKVLHLPRFDVLLIHINDSVAVRPHCTMCTL